MQYLRSEESRLPRVQHALRIECVADELRNERSIDVFFRGVNVIANNLHTNAVQRQ